MTEAELAWAAGLFEGEGNVYLKEGKYPVAQMNMTDEDVVRRFHEVVGVGSFYGPYQHGRNKEGKRYKPFFRWQLGNMTQILDLYMMFEPWLGARRKEQFAKLKVGHTTRAGG